MQKDFNLTELEAVMRRFIEIVDKNPNRTGLVETPKRAAKYWIELLEGQKYTNKEIAVMFDKCFDFEDEDPTNSINNKDLIVEDEIICYSHCEHHLALMRLNIAIAYIPKNKVIGLSKMARIADMVCKRLQIQERIGMDISEIMKTILGTDDVAVIIRGTHACMSARGIKARESITKTASLSGNFMSNPALRQEMYSLINNNMYNFSPSGAN